MIQTCVPEYTGELTDSHLHTGKTKKPAPGRRNETAKGERWKRHFRKHSFKNNSVKHNTIFLPVLTCWRQMQILNMLGFVRWCLKGRRDSPVCAVCPSVSAAYSDQYWRSSRRGDARPGADWQPAEHLWLQAPVATTNLPWNWTQSRIF